MTHAFLHRCTSILLFSISVSLTVRQQALAQTSTPANAIGFPSNGVFTGSSFDNVQMNNGNLHIEIPLQTLPGRGISQHFSEIYDSKGWGFRQLRRYSVDGSSFSTIDIPSPSISNHLKWALAGSATLEAGYSSRTPLFVCGESPDHIKHYGTQKFGYYVQDTDGDRHPFPDLGRWVGGTGCNVNPATLPLYATDGSGWKLVLDSYLNVIEAVSPAGHKTAFSGGTASVNITDTNGNYINAASDTVGRSPNLVDSNGTALNVTTTTATVPIQTKLCPFFPDDACGSEYTQSLTVPASFTLPTGATYTFSYEQNSYGELNRVQLPTGGVISYTWGAPDEGGRKVTSRSVTYNGATYKWTYSWGFIFGASTWKNVMTDPYLNDTVYTCQSMVNVQSWSYTPECFVTRVDLYNGAQSGGVLAKSVVTDYSAGDALAIPPLAIRVTSIYPGGLRSAVETDYDIFPDGNGGSRTAQMVTERRFYDYGNGGPGTLLRREHTNYLHEEKSAYLALNILNKPTTISTYDGSGLLQAQLINRYDESGLQETRGALQHDDVNFGITNVQRGNLTSQSQMISSGLYATSTFIYDTLGNLQSTSDPMLNKETYSYQDRFFGSACVPTTPTYAYRSTASNAKGQQSWTTSYPCTGAVQAITDANNQTQSFTYDRIGRLSSASLPDGGGQNNAYGDGTPSTRTVTTKSSPSADTVVVTTLDGMGESARVEMSAPDGTIVQDVNYDALGRVASVSNPYRQGDPVGYTTTGYDPLGRKKLQTNPDRTTLTWSYNGNSTVFTNEAGNSRTRTADALGRLTQVIEPGSLQTNYTYDTLGNLRSVAQLGVAGETARTRSFTYDSLSRLITSTNPETGTICYGTTEGAAPNATNCSPGYDANGNLKHRTNANSVRTDYSYDTLNRLTQKAYTDGTPTASFTYDNFTGWGQPHGSSLGRLVRASMCGANGCNDDLYGYDAMGRINHIEGATPSEAGHASHWVPMLYDLAGNMTDLTYPDGRHIHQKWDVAGHLSSVDLVGIGGISQVQSYLQPGSYFPDGSPSVLTLGNGVQQTIEKNNRFQVQSIAVSTPLPPFNDQTFLSKAYCYVNCVNGLPTADNGNIGQITDTLNVTRTQAFTYDALNRISSFSLGGTLNQQYAIDSFGNLSGVVGGKATTSFSPATNRNTLPCPAPTQGYDAAGNQICDNDSKSATRVYTYDAESHVSQIAMLNNKTNPFETYTYGADGNRVRKSSPPAGAFTEYVYVNGQPIAEKDQTGAWTDYIYANGQKIARVAQNVPLLHFYGSNPQSGVECGAGLISGNINYLVKSGDKLSWVEYKKNAVGGMGQWFDNNSISTAWHSVDTNGYTVNQDPRMNQWVTRTLDLTPYATHTLSSLGPTKDVQTAAGAWEIWYGDIAVYSVDGTVTPLLGSAGIAAPYGAECQGPYTTVGVEMQMAATAPGLAGSGADTHFYFGDHLGSAQMEFTAGGWPVSSSQFGPFGGELTDASVSANHYRFTGKERDAESGLDYFGARYYASTMGRWMSPDPGKINPKHLMNPQKWNKYAYVLNNPLSLVDPNGEEEMWIQYRAFIPPAQVGVGAASGRGDNRTFSSQENASSRVSMTMHIETDPAKNGGNPLLGVTTGINTTHNNLTGKDTPAVVVQAPTVTATQDANGNVNLNVQMNVHSGDLPAATAIRSDVNIGVNQAGTQASVSGTTSVSPAFETNIAPQGGPTTNIPVQNAPQGTVPFMNGLLHDHQVNTGTVPIKQPQQ